MKKLKPCPFCGNEKVECAEINFEDENIIYSHIQCSGCKQYVSTAWYCEDENELNDILENNSEIIWDKAIALWNRRA